MTTIFSEVFAEFIAPTHCAGCERPGSLLCADCMGGFDSYYRSRACPTCGSVEGALNCTECAVGAFSFDHVIALGVLDGALARAIVLYKDGFERRLGKVLGELLASRVTMFGEWPDVITWVPPTDSALRRRGFDHGRELALGVGDALMVPLIATAVRPVSQDMRNLGASMRKARAMNSFKPVGNIAEKISGRKVLLVDDVFTTGATAEAMTQLLNSAGTALVQVAVVARAW